MTETAASIVQALVGSSAFAVFVTWLLKKKRDKKKENHFPWLLSQRELLHKTIDDLRAETNASIVLLLKSENGGGVPDPVSILHSTALYASPGRQGLDAAWQKTATEHGDDIALLSMLREGDVEFSVPKMKPGKFKDYLDSGGAVSARMIFVQRSEVMMLYILAGWKSPPDDGREATNRVNFRIASQKIGQMSKKGIRKSKSFI